MWMEPAEWWNSVMTFYTCIPEKMKNIQALSNFFTVSSPLEQHVDHHGTQNSGLPNTRPMRQFHIKEYNSMQGLTL